MKKPGRVTLYMREDVFTGSEYEEQNVPHHFSPEDAIEIIIVTLRALARVLTPQECRDLAEVLVGELRRLQSTGDIEAAASSRLKIHEAL